MEEARIGGTDSGIILTSEQHIVLEKIKNTSQNIFLTGKAGTGKTFVIEEFKRDSGGKEYVLLSPTGTAAINIGGMTIHRFFHLGKCSTLDNCKPFKYKEALLATDVIIIDEVSMVRADLLDVVDKVLRITLENELPFGGKQMVLVGDVAQLPPVAKPLDMRYLKDNGYSGKHFFDAFSYKVGGFETVELCTMMRQKSEEFIGLLNSVRVGMVDWTGLTRLNTCVKRQLDEKSIVLTARKKTAYDINTSGLQQLKDSEHIFEAEISGEIDEEDYPTDLVLSLKVGARVMSTVNGKGLVYSNGSLGTVVEILEHLIVVKFDHLEGIVWMGKEKWKIQQRYYDKEKKTIKYFISGEFIQFPLKLAWAITIHKSQGKTFDNVVIDLGVGAFECGQTYVALSRCRSLEGISLAYRIQSSDILVDQRVVRFMGG